MWPPWGKSPSRTPRRTNFSCSSFKDIQTLFKEDEHQEEPQPQPHQEPPQKKKPSLLFHRVRLTTAALRAWSIHRPPPGIVVYFTSLRVVRKTFEDCRTVRSILKGFRVSIDERDLSMDAGFLDELQKILGLSSVRWKKNQFSSNMTLPRVFIGGRYIGGADEIKQLHESGELKKFIQGFPTVEPGVCDECGGYRFVLCYQCDGSHKLYSEKEGGGEFRSCLACNENGLIRCTSCSPIQHRDVLDQSC